MRRDCTKTLQKRDILWSTQLELTTLHLNFYQITLLYDSHNVRRLHHLQITDQEASQHPPQASQVRPG